jgi:hypothetical protein
MTGMKQNLRHVLEIGEAVLLDESFWVIYVNISPIRTKEIVAARPKDKKIYG